VAGIDERRPTIGPISRSPTPASALASKLRHASSFPGSAWERPNARLGLAACVWQVLLAPQGVAGVSRRLPPVRFPGGSLRSTPATRDCQEILPHTAASTDCLSNVGQVDWVVPGKQSPPHCTPRFAAGREPLGAVAAAHARLAENSMPDSPPHRPATDATAEHPRCRPFAGRWIELGLFVAAYMGFAALVRASEVG